MRHSFLNWLKYLRLLASGRRSLTADQYYHLFDKAYKVEMFVACNGQLYYRDVNVCCRVIGTGECPVDWKVKVGVKPEEQLVYWVPETA